MSHIDFTKLVLNIDDHLIADHKNTLEYSINIEKDLNKAIAIINKFHSYFHFEQSNIYLNAAKIYKFIGNQELELEFLEKAIFQDHINYEAIAEIAKFDRYLDQAHGENIKYNSFIKFERDFIDFSIEHSNFCDKIASLDRALKYFDQDKYKVAEELIVELEFKTHRYYLLKTGLLAAKNQISEAITFLNQAIEIIERAHLQYHLVAASTYKARGLRFLSLGDDQLAQNDFIKAKGLNPKIEI